MQWDRQDGGMQGPAESFAWRPQVHGVHCRSFQLTPGWLDVEQEMMACRLWRRADVNRAVAKPRLVPTDYHPARLRAPLAGAAR